MTTAFDVILGLDVGKTAHHGCALTADAAKLYDKELPQDHGAVLVVVDQPNTIGALPFAVAPRLWSHRRHLSIQPSTQRPVRYGQGR